MGLSSPGRPLVWMVGRLSLRSGAEIETMVTVIDGTDVGDVKKGQIAVNLHPEPTMSVRRTVMLDAD